MPAARLPEYRPHSAAKHRLLRLYLNAWFPILARKHANVALVDGFASAGRYATGEPGSPLIMLEAYRGRDDRRHLRATPHYFFIEEKRSYVRHLTAEVEALGQLNDVDVNILKGQYAERFLEVVDRLVALGGPPTFAFVDPYGYSDNPFDRIQEYKRRIPRSTEAMVYLPATHMARFEATGITARALTSAFGGESWKDASDEATRRAKSEALKDIFYAQMKEVFAWVTAFRVEPRGGNAYYLVFGTDHKLGLRRMKEGMWSVDKTGGRAYRYKKPTAKPEFEQPQFEGMEDKPPADEDIGLDLRRLLQAEFGERDYLVEEAEDFTLTRTKYLDNRHLKRMTLLRAEREGVLEVDPNTRSRPNSFTEGTRMRFAPD